MSDLNPMKWLRKLTRWWQGSPDPSARAEVERLQEQIDTRRASVSGAGWSGASGTHGHESDYRGS